MGSLPQQADGHAGLAGSAITVMQQHSSGGHLTSDREDISVSRYAHISPVHSCRRTAACSLRHSFCHIIGYGNAGLSAGNNPAGIMADSCLSDIPEALVQSTATISARVYTMLDDELLSQYVLLGEGCCWSASYLEDRPAQQSYQHRGSFHTPGACAHVARQTRGVHQQLALIP